MNTDERKAARARCEAATPGPWVNMPDGPLFGLILASGDHICEMPPLDDRTEDFEFIAHARTDLPAALDALDAKDAEIAGLMEALKEQMEYCRDGNNVNYCALCHVAECKARAALEGRE